MNYTPDADYDARSSAGEGWLYSTGAKDVFTGEIVGYALRERMNQGLTSHAL